MLCSISFPTSLNAIAISPMEDFVCVGGVDGNVYKVNLWDIKSNDFSVLDQNSKLPQLFVGHDSIQCLDLNIDGTLLVTGGQDGSIKVWSTSTCQLLHTFSTEEGGSNAGPVTHVSIIFLSPNLFSTSLGAKRKHNSLEPLANSPYRALAIDVVPLSTKNTNALMPDVLLGEEARRSYILDHLTPPTSILQEPHNQATSTPDVEQLKDEIAKLREANSRWKSVANEMLRSMCNNTDTQET